MDIKEARKMLGTEFIYIYEDGDTILAYVKAFDPEVGLTCYTLEEKTRRDGWISSDIEEEESTWCVIGFDFSVQSHTLEEALEKLQVIRDAGVYQASSNYGSASCAFM